MIRWAAKKLPCRSKTLKFPTPFSTPALLKKSKQFATSCWINCRTPPWISEKSFSSIARVGLIIWASPNQFCKLRFYLCRTRTKLMNFKILELTRQSRTVFAELMSTRFYRMFMRRLWSQNRRLCQIRNYTRVGRASAEKNTVKEMNV
jgi:hypothetical protein